MSRCDGWRASAPKSVHSQLIFLINWVTQAKGTVGIGRGEGGTEEGREGKVRKGRGRKGLDRDGKETERKGREGKSMNREEKGWVKKGKEGCGREGKEGQGIGRRNGR